MKALTDSLFINMESITHVVLSTFQAKILTPQKRSSVNILGLVSPMAKALQQGLWPINSLRNWVSWHPSIPKMASRFFTSAYFGCCIRHLGKNLRTNYHNKRVVTLFDRAAKAYSREEFLDHFNQITDMNPKVSEFLICVRQIDYKFSITGHGDVTTGDFQTRSCTCRVFDLDKVPYPHAMAALRSQYSHKYGAKVYEHSSQYYSVEKYKMAYIGYITPVPPDESWVVPAKLMGKLIPPPYIDPRTTKPRIKPYKRRRGVGESFSSRRNKCSIYNATSEHGLNEHFHKVKDQNSKEEVSRAQEIDTIIGHARLQRPFEKSIEPLKSVQSLLDIYTVAKNLNPSPNLTQKHEHKRVLLTVLVLLDGVCGICGGGGSGRGGGGGTSGGCWKQSEAEERYENNIERGGQGSADGDEENKNNKKEELESEKEKEKEKEDDHQQGLGILNHSSPPKAGNRLSDEVSHPGMFRWLAVKSNTKIKEADLFNPLDDLVHLLQADPGVSSGRGVGVGDRNDDASTTHDDEHVDGQEKINMFENTLFTLTQHVDKILCLMRKRQLTYLEAYDTADRIMDLNYCKKIKDKYDQLNNVALECGERFDFLVSTLDWDEDEMITHVRVERPNPRGKSWTEAKRILVVISINDIHYNAIEILFEEGKIKIYDCNDPLIDDVDLFLLM
ncbi:hypothetical protein FXO37_17806 [Capsicum annuum]|nr:hypothetical protein FXO37_17806 [Capsicum annuum]